MNDGVVYEGLRQKDSHFNTSQTYKIGKCEYTARERCHFERITALRWEMCNWFRQNPKLRSRWVCICRYAILMVSSKNPLFAISIRNMPWVVFYFWRSASPSSLLTFWDTCLDFLPSVNGVMFCSFYIQTHFHQSITLFHVVAHTAHLLIRGS